MVRQLPPVTLKSGEQAEIYKVTAPEPEWEQRLVPLLEHKGELWTRAMSQALREDLPGLTMAFYQMRLDDQAAGNATITQALERPVAMLEHVFTDPNHRRKGICNHLMALVMQDFAAENGRAMYLGTDHEDLAFRIYLSLGFRPIGSTGSMVWILDENYPDDFFVPGKVRVRPVEWSDWPLLTALYQVQSGWDLRGYVFGQFGHSSYEGTYCKLREWMAADKAQQVTALECVETGAIVGHAFVARDEKWPYGPHLLEFFVHPLFLDHATRLLDAIDLPPETKIQAYCDGAARDRAEILQALGFSLEATLPLQYRTKAGPPTDVHIYALMP